MGYTVVCISGSMRFYPTMLKAAARLNRAMYIVLMPFADKRDIQEKDDIRHISIEQELDKLHLAKIDMCSVVVVIDTDGTCEPYTGSSTKNEIAYALSRQKHVTYYSQNKELELL